MEFFCTVKPLPPELAQLGAKNAVMENPANEVRVQQLADTGAYISPQHLALVTSRWWGAGGANLSVQFQDTQNAELKAKILLFANNWGKYGNVLFRESSGQGDIRVRTDPADGYWSNMGTDARLIPPGKNTMNLAGFTVNTPVSEYLRVVQHEFGHAIGFDHEHARAAIVALLDPEKVVAVFGASQGWDRQMVYDQILTVDPESSLTANSPDVHSIMCYPFPASCTRSGQPIPGGTDLTDHDKEWVARVYLKKIVPVGPPAAEWKIILSGTGLPPTIAKG